MKVSVPQAQSVPVALAPAAAIGTLEALAFAATTAAFIGIISSQQNQDYQNQINQMIIEIEKAVKESANKALVHTMDKAAELIAVISFAVRSCDSSSSKIPDRRAKARSAQCTGSVENCCRDFFSQFQGRFERRNGGYRFFDSRRKFLCCAEWDAVHGGFEIFDSRGNHYGERGCEDLNEDPCRFTASRGTHALPNSSSHRPRTNACRP